MFSIALSVFGVANATAGVALEKVSGDRVVIDLKYNSDVNFLHKNVYGEFGLRDCYVLPEVHSKLLAAFPILKEKKLKLVMFDCYRPLSVQRKMWEIVPDSRYVANPAKGSNHNRAVAIDVTLAREDGTLLPMPTEFDDFTEKAFRSFKCGTEKAEQEKCQNRELLEQILKQVGLQGLATEWWHFELPGAKKFPVIEDFNAKSH